MAFDDWSTNPANNSLVGSINWSEGQLPGTVNGSARQMMADLATWRDMLMSGVSPFALVASATFTGEVTFNAGAHFKNNIDVAFVGNPQIKVESVGVVAGWLSAQADGNIVLYRDDGMGTDPIWASDGTAFNTPLPIKRNGNTVWDAGNDGPGSGLDADTVDGYQAAAFERLTASNLGDNNGYRVHADGFKECWGYVSVPANGSVAVTLPVTHVSWANPVLGPSIAASPSDSENMGLISNGLSGFTIYNANNGALTCFWQTKGV